MLSYVLSCTTNIGRLTHALLRSTNMLVKIALWTLRDPSSTTNMLVVSFAALEKTNNLLVQESLTGLLVSMHDTLTHVLVEVEKVCFIEY